MVLTDSEKNDADYVKAYALAEREDENHVSHM